MPAPSPFFRTGKLKAAAPEPVLRRTGIQQLPTCFLWILGTGCPRFAAFAVCSTWPVFWLSTAAVAEARPDLTCAPQIPAGQAFSSIHWMVLVVQGLWFTPARSGQGLFLAPHVPVQSSAALRTEGAVLLIAFYRMNANPLAFWALCFTSSTEH